MNYDYICVPLLCMLDLFYSKMVGLLSNREATDTCTGAEYELYISLPREKQELGIRRKGLRIGRVDSPAFC